MDAGPYIAVDYIHTDQQRQEEEEEEKKKPLFVS